MFNMHVVLYSACFYVLVNCYHAMLKHTSFVLHAYVHSVCVYIYKKKKGLIYAGLLQVNLSYSMHV